MNNKVTFESVIIQEDKKEAILSAISQLDNHNKIFKEWGFEEVFEKGTAVSMIFYGLPGTGKTLMAQAIADQRGIGLLTVGPAEIETNVPGGAERNIKKYFKIASGKQGLETGEKDENGKPIVEPKQKYVLLFDECDSLITDRTNVGMIIAGQINTLLSEIEHFTGIVVFTTNRLGTLDSAMERRMSAKIEFDAPDEEMRKKIWARMIPKKAPLHSDVSTDSLSIVELSGGAIKNVVLNAAREAAYTQSDVIEMKHFMNAIQREALSIKGFKKAMSDNGQVKLHGGSYSRTSTDKVLTKK